MRIPLGCARIIVAFLLTQLIYFQFRGIIYEVIGERIGYIAVLVFGVCAGVVLADLLSKVFNLFSKYTRVYIAHPPR